MTTLSSDSSTASSDSRSAEPFLSSLSQKLASSSAKSLVCTFLLQNTSKASLSALWKSELEAKQSSTVLICLSCSSMMERMKACSLSSAFWAPSAVLSVSASSTSFTLPIPSASTCFLKMSATGLSPSFTRLKRRNMRDRSSSLSSRSSAATPLCSFSSSCAWWVVSSSRSASLSSLGSLLACR